MAATSQAGKAKYRWGAALAALVAVLGIVANMMAWPVFHHSAAGDDTAPISATLPPGQNTITVNVDANGQPLAGATLQLLSGDGTWLYEQWTSDGNPKVFANIADGRYIIHEVAAPAGCQAGADQTAFVGQQLAAEPGSVVSNASLSTGSTGLFFGGHQVYGLNDSVQNAPTNLAVMNTQKLRSLSGGTAVTSEAIANRDKILAALLLGYPNNAWGLQGQFGLVDVDFSNLTQCVIWYYTNNESLQDAYADGYARDDFKAAYNDFMAAVEKAVIDGTIANHNSTVYSRVPGYGTYQPFVDAQFGTGQYIRSATVNVVNTGSPEPSPSPSPSEPSSEPTDGPSSSPSPDPSSDPSSSTETPVVEPSAGPTAAPLPTGDGVLTVNKVDGSNSPLAGATLQLLNADGTALYEEWESDGTAKVFRVASGTYRIRETAAPEGYDAAGQDTIVTIGTSLSNPNSVLSETPNATAKQPTVGFTDYPSGISLGGHVVYCLDKRTAATNNPTRYMSETSLINPDSNFQNENTGSAVRSKGKEIRAALLLGYPNDVAGLQSQYGLSDSYFHRLTAETIWYYTNGLDPFNLSPKDLADGIYASDADKDAHDDPTYRASFNAFRNAVEAAVAANTFEGLDTNIYYFGNKKQPVVDAMFQNEGSASVKIANFPSGQNTPAPPGDGVLKVDKTDEDWGGNVVGATLQLLSADGTKRYAQWVTDGNTKEFKGLAPGSYIIREVAAPEGYLLAEDRVVEVTGSSWVRPAAVPTNTGVQTQTTGTAVNFYTLNGHVVYNLSQGNVLSSTIGLASVDVLGGDFGANADYAYYLDMNRNSMLAVMMLGYPNNATGLQQQLNLSDSDFRKLTQCVLWRYTYTSLDHLNLGSMLTTTFRANYQTFVEAVDAAVRADSFSASNTSVYYLASYPSYGWVIDAQFTRTNAQPVTVDFENKLGRQVKVVKNWQDSSGAAVSAPADAPAVTFDIYAAPASSVNSSNITSATAADRQKYTSVTLDGSESTPWQKTVVGLPWELNGVAVNYYAIERPVDGYVQVGEPVFLSFGPSRKWDTFTFTNKRVWDSSVTFQGLKTLEGKELEAGEFDFELWTADAQGAKTGAGPIETVQNGADGAVAFSTIAYSQADVAERAGEAAQATYRYVVVEAIPSERDPSITYDKNEWLLTVTVDKGSGAVSVTRDERLAEGQDFLFENEYSFNAPLTSVERGGVGARTLIVLLFSLAGAGAGLWLGLARTSRRR